MLACNDKLNGFSLVRRITNLALPLGPLFFPMSQPKQNIRIGWRIVLAGIEFNDFKRVPWCTPFRELQSLSFPGKNAMGKVLTAILFYDNLPTKSYIHVACLHLITVI